jgi:chitinase
MSAVHRVWRASAVVLVGIAALFACTQPGDIGEEEGGSSGNGHSGGASSSVGGATASGGAVASGGATASGGAVASGGATASGGAVASGGSAGVTGSGGSGAESACGSTPGYAGPQLGRCDPTWCDDGTCSVPGAGTTTAKGGFITLDSFEGTPVAVTSGAASIPMAWPARDGRTGSWALYAHAAAGAKIEVAGAEAGGSPNSNQALHFTGLGSTAADFYPTTTGLPISNCYDASAYDGISLWIKGNPTAGHDKIKLSLHTPPTQPKLSWDGKKGSGICEAGCYDHFAALLPVTTTWTRHVIPWANFKRLNCTATTPPMPDTFDPQKMILEVSFSQLDPTLGYDVWIDDITFDVDTKTANSFAEVVTEPIFNEMFKTPTSGMDHAALVQAVSTYGGAYGTGTLGSNGDALANKHEAAAFLAQIAHETGSLTLLEEDCSTSCTTNDGYHGRGVIQLTHKYNYETAQTAGPFPGIVATPSLVLSNKQFAFGVGIYFWMTYQSSKGICHDQINAQSFGGTTNIINGIECGGALQDSRVALYQQFCAAFGINPRGTLKC